MESKPFSEKSLNAFNVSIEEAGGREETSQILLHQMG